MDTSEEPRASTGPQRQVDAAPTLEDRSPSRLSDASASHLSAEALRTRGYRNTMAAGALSLTLLCGLAFLVFVVRDIVPRAQQQLLPTPEPILYVTTLWCPPCEQAGSPIVLWEKVGDGVSRGGKTGELLHNTQVGVTAKEWSAPEGRTYYRVTAQGQSGWVPETFIKEPD